MRMLYLHLFQCWKAMSFTSETNRKRNKNRTHFLPPHLPIALITLHSIRVCSPHFSLYQILCETASRGRARQKIMRLAATLVKEGGVSLLSGSTWHVFCLNTKWCSRIQPRLDLKTARFLDCTSTCEGAHEQRECGLRSLAVDANRVHGNAIKWWGWYFGLQLNSGVNSKLKLPIDELAWTPQLNFMHVGTKFSSSHTW